MKIRSVNVCMTCTLSAVDPTRLRKATGTIAGDLEEVDFIKCLKSHDLINLFDINLIYFEIHSAH